MHAGFELGRKSVVEWVEVGEDAEPGATFEPGDTLTFMFCPMVNGRPGGHMGWAKLADGRFVNASDGGCNGNEENIERWKGWLAHGYLSNKEAADAE